MTSGRPAVLEASVPPRDVARVYDRSAPAYDLWGRLTEYKARAWCPELAAIQDRFSVLEVAAGAKKNTVSS